MNLDVYVNQALVGTLEQVEVNRFVFAYQANVTSNQAVSLLMPVRLESWVHAALHPVFQVSLPEGALKQFLTKRFAKHFDYFGDMALLSVVGAHLVGRIKLAPHGSALSAQSPFEDLHTLLQSSSKEVVDRFLEEHADTSGVSGGFPKFLAKSLLPGQSITGIAICTVIYYFLSGLDLWSYRNNSARAYSPRSRLRRRAQGEFSRMG